MLNNKKIVSLDECLDRKLITYVPFPDDLYNQYQPDTCADLTLLRESGYRKSMSETQDSVLDFYAKQLNRNG